MMDNIWLVPTTVKPSEIHGLGRFADADVPIGKPVLILCGDVVKKTGRHIPIQGTDYCIACPQTFINHSGDPNLRREGQIVFVSSRDIRSGEELLLDYGSLTTSRLGFI